MSRQSLWILFVVWCLLVLTTPFNPLINQPYLTLAWYLLLQAYVIWFVAQLASVRR